MIWFFERDQESLELETRYDNDRSEFVAVVRYPDGHEKTERFRGSHEYGLWLEALERDLAVERWTARTGPAILPDGWPHKRVT